MRRALTIFASAALLWGIGLTGAAAASDTEPPSCEEIQTAIDDNREARKAAAELAAAKITERDNARQAAADAREKRDMARERVAGALKARDDARASMTEALANRDAARAGDGTFEGKTDDEWQAIADKRKQQADAKDALAADQQAAADAADALATQKQNEADAADAAVSDAQAKMDKLDAELKKLIYAKKKACDDTGPSAVIGQIDCEAGTVSVTLDNSKAKAETEFTITSKFGDETKTQTVTVPAGKTKTVGVAIPDEGTGTITVAVGDLVLARDKVEVDCTEDPGEPAGPSAKILGEACESGGVGVLLDNSKSDTETRFEIVSAFGDTTETVNVTVPAGETKNAVAPAPTEIQGTITVSAGGEVILESTGTLICGPGGGDGDDDKGEFEQKGSQLPFTGSPLRLILLVAVALIAAGAATLGGLKLARNRS